MRAGARAIEADAGEARRQYLADLYGGVSIERAAYVALRAQRLMAFGRRLLHNAIQSAIHRELENLTPVAPVGPIRLQAESVAKSLILEQIGAISQPVPKLLDHLRRVGRVNLPQLQMTKQLLAEHGYERTLVRILDVLLWASHPDVGLTPRLGDWERVVRARRD